MKFEQVLPALREGKKILLPSWDKGEYLCIGITNDLVDENGKTPASFPIGFDDWEIVEEPKKYSVKFWIVARKDSYGEITLRVERKYPSGFKLNNAIGCQSIFWEFKEGEGL